MSVDFSKLKECKPDLNNPNYTCPMCKGSGHLTLRDSQKKVKCVCYSYVKAYSVLGKDLYHSFDLLDPKDPNTPRYDLSSNWGSNSYFLIPTGTKGFKTFLAQTIMKNHSPGKGFRFAYEEFFELMQIYLGNRSHRYSDLLDFIGVNNAFFIRIGDTEMDNKHLDQAMRQFINIVGHHGDKFLWFISSHRPDSETIQRWYGKDFVDLTGDFTKEKIKNV